MRSFIDKNEGLDALRALVPQVAAAIRDVSNPDATAIGTWSARDVAAHLVDVAEDHQNVARGHGTAVGTSEEIAAHNQRRIEARGRLDMRQIAELYEKEMNAYLDMLGEPQDDPLVPWAELKIPLSTVIALDIAEAQVHGYDITQAEKRPWKIDPHFAALSGRGISPVTEQYVDKDAAAGLDACFDLRLRGEWALHFVFSNGELTIEEPADRRVDVHISADPVVFMLVGYGRVSQWGPIGKGQLLTWGRKPWLALRFSSLLKNP